MIRGGCKALSTSAKPSRMIKTDIATTALIARVKIDFVPLFPLVLFMI
jgi:hypothetical protein